MKRAVLAIVLTACGAAPASVPEPSAPPALVVADGLPIYPGTLDDAPARVREVYRRLVIALESPPIASPDDPSIAGTVAWAETTFTQFLTEHRDRVAAMERLANELAERSPAEALFAAISVALAFEDFARRIESVPSPEELGDDQELLAVFRNALSDAAAPLIRRAAAAYGYCRERSDSLDSSMRAWAERCSTRAAELEARAQARPERAQTARADTVRAEMPPIEWPAECATAVAPLTPEAPPPDLRQPEAIAIVTSYRTFEGADRRRLIEAVRARVEGHVRTTVLETSEVEAAEALRAQSRVLPRGPVCGQPPPLAWVLAQRRPNLVLGEVTGWCPLPLLERAQSCRLQVRFRRAGSARSEGLPGPFEAEVAGDPPTPAAWLEAATRLEPGLRPAGGITVGVRRADGGVELRVRDDSDEDPWLRAQDVLGMQQDALAACLPGGVVSLTTRLRVSPSGQPSEVVVEPRTGGSTELAACVRRAIAASRWPCTPSAREQQVEVTLCLGRR